MPDHQKYAKHFVSGEKKKKPIYIDLISKCSLGGMKRIVLTYFIGGFSFAVCVLGC